MRVMDQQLTHGEAAGADSDIRTVWDVLSGLAMFRDVVDSPVGTAVRQWAERVAIGDGRLREPYAAIFAALAAEWVAAGTPAEAARDDAWTTYWIRRILTADNSFSACAARAGAAGTPAALLDAATQDLEALRRFAASSGAAVQRVTHEAISAAGRSRPANPAGGAADEASARLPNWAGIPVDPVPVGTVHRDAFTDMAARFMDAVGEVGGWAALAPALADFYRDVGVGKVARFGAFRWERGGLRGIASPDPARLAELIGYERERGRVVENTEQFVRGLPSNNVLLYGERGTGKSATVKALLHEFGPKGLRLVELPKAGLEETAHIFRRLSEHRQRFILFIDDLSFEGEEVAYKELKAVLEGGLERQPDNVRIYATSNRRHLVQERMRERPRGPYGVDAEPGEDEEVRGWDVVQERLSLADRFGLTVVFQSPDQELYLDIVRGLAERRGIALPPEELRAAAVRWTLQQNGRSARTAHQFVDDLEGRLRLT